jgi:hypothetical protein
MLKSLLGAAAAFALLAATPAVACEECQKHQAAQAAPAGQKTSVAEEKKDEHKGCHCTSAKDCKCGEKCGCASCKAKVEKKEEQKKS